MNVKYVILLVFLISTKQLFGQSVCSLTNSPQENFHKCIIGYTNTSTTYKVQSVVKTILDKTGIPDANFVLKGCNETYNAGAVIYNGTRYIILDEPYINWLSPSDNSDWLYIFILSHEIAHHLNGHTLISSQNYSQQRQRELECDKFAGFVLKKLGGTKDNIYSSLSSIPNPNENNTTHPILQDRLKAAYEGFDMAFEEEISILNKYKTYLETFYKERFYEIDLSRAREHMIDFALSNDEIYLQKSLNYYLKVVGENQSDAGIYEEVSDIYLYLGDYYNSMLYSEKAYSISKSPEHLIFAYARCSDATNSNILKANACDKYTEKLKNINYQQVTEPKFLLELGKFHGNIGENSKAEIIINSAITKIRSQITVDSNDLLLLSDMLNDLSVTQLRQSKYQSAYTNIIESMKISESIKDRYNYKYYTEIDKTNKSAQLLNKAFLENRLKKWDESNKTCARLETNDFYFPKQCYYIQGSNYQNLENYPKAIEKYDLAIKYEEDLELIAEYYYLRGLSKYAANNKKGGCSDLMIASDKGNKESLNKYEILCAK